MEWRRRLAGLCVTLLAVSHCEAQQYFPSECQNKCNSLSDFQVPLPRTPTGVKTQAAKWSIVALNQIRDNLGRTSPPGASRALAIFSTCMYEGMALFDGNLKPFAAQDLFKVGVFDPDLVDRAIDGAAVRALTYVFQTFSTVGEVEKALWNMGVASGEDISSFLSFMGRGQPKRYTGFPDIFDVKRMTPALAIKAGSIACDKVIEKFSADGYDGLGNALDGSNPVFTGVNRPQSRAGVTNCASEMSDLSRWQALCVPRNPGASVGTTDCNVQRWLAPTAGEWTTLAIPRGSPTDGKALIDAVSRAEQVQGGPPIFGQGDAWEKQWMEVVKGSATLDDPRKLVAEYWADGPDSTFPPGTWFLFAVNAAESRGLGSQETVKLLTLVGNALNDAGVGCWRVKRTFDSIRPLQMVQCGSSGSANRDVTAWRGPYQGVGQRSAAAWQPYQQDTFITPPFGAYVSGHSTFSAAAAEVMKLYFGSDDFVGPKCASFEEGSSAFEQRSGSVPGVSDVPNSGKDTVGYSPRSRVTLCWDTFSAGASQASESRIYGGIHVRADADDGLALGRQIGRAVFREGNQLFRKYVDVTSVF